MNRTIAATICLVALLAGSNTRADNIKIAENWIEAWNSHDVERILSIFTPAVLYEDVAFGVVNHGAAELRVFATGFFTAVPDIRLDLVTSSFKGGHGTIEWILSGTDVGLYKTGKRFSVRGVSVIEVEGQKISLNRDYYDLATVQRQLGLLPPPL